MSQVKPYIRLLVIACWWIAPIALIAQSYEVRFEHIPSREGGLSHPKVHTILQDSRGFMWFGTENGLDRFDGVDFVSYRQHPLDSLSLPHNNISALIESQDSMLWVGFRGGGIARFNPRTGNFEAFRHQLNNPSSLINDWVYALLEDRKGQIWIGTDGGLTCFDPKTKIFRLVRSSTEYLSNPILDEIYSIAEDMQGHIWIGTGHEGIIRLNPESGQTHWYTAGGKEGLSNNRISSLLCDKQGTIWAGTGDSQINQFDEHQEKFTQLSYSPIQYQPQQAYQPMTIQMDGNRGLWIGTQMHGLIHYNLHTNAVENYTHTPLDPFSLSTDAITSIFVDQQGALWVGTGSEGISKMDPKNQNFPYWAFRAKNPFGAVVKNFTRLFPASDGSLWHATWGEGLHRFDPATSRIESHFAAPQHPDSLSHNIIWDIVEDFRNNLWIGTQGGLDYLDFSTRTFSHYYYEQGNDSSLWHPGVKALTIGQDGRIWIGTFSGLNVLNPRNGQMIRYRLSSGQPFDYLVQDLLTDRAGNIWVATNSDGLFHIDPISGKNHHFSHNTRKLNSLASNTPLYLKEDTQGRIWIGTSGGGLNLFQPKDDNISMSTFRHWRSYNSPIASDNVYLIAEDRNQKLWITTGQGVMQFVPEHEAWNTIRTPHGLPDIGFRASDGHQGIIYAYGKQKIYHINVDSLLSNLHIPPVIITGLRLFNQPVAVQGSLADTMPWKSPLLQHLPFTREIYLGHQQNDIAFEFAALNYTEPEKNRYAYRLEGYQEEWVSATANRRFASYTNLKPGTYTFQVKGSNNDGIWNEVPAAIQMVIAVPWWASWWAYTTYCLLTLSTLYAIRRYEMNRQQFRHQWEIEHMKAARLEELDQVKSRFFTNISHEFRTPLTVIIGMADLMRQSPQKWMDEGLTAVNRNGQNLLRLVNQMLDLSKLDSGHMKLNLKTSDIVNYLRYLIESFHSYAQTKDIRLHSLFELDSLYMPFDAERLSHVIANLLSNGIKFTPNGGDIYIHVDRIDMPSGQHLKIRVRDTGIGIPTDKLPYIFDRFYHSENKQTDLTAGIGIGLAFTKELMGMMEGHIGVNSTQGNGSEFIISLPIRQESPELVPDKTSAPDSLAPTPSEQMSQSSSFVTDANMDDRPRILLAEDNQDVITYLLACLQPDYQLEVAYDGRQGIDKALTLIPDLIISDVMMPLKDGYAVCEFLKNDPRTSHIPIILLTAKADDDSRLQGLQRGADAYLAKPFIPEELHIRIRNLLARRQQLQAYYLSLAGVVPTSVSPLVIPPTETWEDPFILRLRAIIESHLEDSEFSIKDLSHEVAMSEATLYRKVKSLLGTSAGEVIQSIRLNRAKQLLQENRDSISDIAFASGFNDPSYFSKVFKEHVGMSPTAYRRNLKE